jgi:NADPH2:quinone reductase
MKALVLKQSGRPAQMVIEQRDKPVARTGFSLVRMHAATVNPLSSQIRAGLYDTVSVPIVLSNDGAGIVEQSARFPPGTRVAIYGGGQLGVSEDGLQQEWVLVEDKRLIELPQALNLNEGAALPINYVTAYQALRRVGQLKTGQTVLISGASGSLGNALIQTARALGATVIGVVSSAQKAQRATAAGAHQVIDLSCQNLLEAVLALTNGQGADLAFDGVGGTLLGQLLRAVRTRGAVVSIGFAGGTTAEVDVVDVVVYEKRLLGYDAHLETEEDVHRALQAISAFIADGLLRPHIDSTFALEQFNEAYARLESRQATGTVLFRL